MTVLVYTGISIRLSLAKKQMIDEDQKADQILKPKKIGWFTKFFPHVSKYAWSTIDLKNLYVRAKILNSAFISYVTIFLELHVCYYWRFNVMEYQN